MTVQNTNRKSGPYLTNGEAVYWPYTFEIFTKNGADIKLYETNISTGETVEITENLTKDIDNARIKYPTSGEPRPTGYKLTIVRETARTQGVGLSTQSFDPKNMEKGLDKLTAIAQELDETFSRSIVTNIASPGQNLTLPDPVAGKIIGWNGDGSGLMNLDNTSAGIEAMLIQQSQQATNAANTAAESVTLIATKVSFWKANTLYSLGKVCYPPLNPHIMLECVVAGTSGTGEPSSFTVGALLNDGTVKWIVRDVRNISPAMSFDDVTIKNTATTITLAAGALIGVHNANYSRVINLYIDSAISVTSSLAASTEYHLWLVYTAATGITEMILTASTTPPNYDYYRHLGGRFTDGSSNLYIIIQKGKKCQYVVDGTILTGLRTMVSGVGGNVNTPIFIEVAVSSYVPLTATSIILQIVTGNSAAIVSPNNKYGGQTNYDNPPLVRLGVSATPAHLLVEFLLESSYIYYAGDTSNSRVKCLGWIEK